jgi:hypothetical protein
VSAETSAWAKEQRCGDRTVKAVLREIANWARPDGVVEFLSVRRIADVVEVDPRTVKRCIAKLEEPTLEHPDRLGLIRRTFRFRDDGGQGANGFVLVGYQSPMTLEGGKDRLPPSDKMSPPHDMGVTPPSDKMSREGGTPASPLKRDKILPLSPPDGGDTPPGKKMDGEGGSKRSNHAAGDGEPKAQPAGKRTAGRSVGHRLPEDWALPPQTKLPPTARALVADWPSGAYEAVGEAFMLHWRSETRAVGCKSDWTAALGKWIISEHPKVMGAKARGISYTSAAPVLPSAAQAASAPVLKAKAREDWRSAKLHGLFKEALGERAYGHWLAGAAVLVTDEGEVHVLLPSAFAVKYVSSELAAKLRVAVRGGMPEEWPDVVPLRFLVGKPVEGDKWADKKAGGQ